MKAVARQFTPDPVAVTVVLPRRMPRVLGMGAHLKASICLIEGDAAMITAPAGDMETLEAVKTYEGLLAGMQARATGPVACIAHDLHPDFHSTRLATTMGQACLAVQHHHAHIAATVAEHGLDGPVLGLALDGFGLGDDGTAWGGELLWVDGTQYRRLGHLKPLAQPGGDIAARQPWRMAAAALHGLGRGDQIATRFADQPLAGMLAQMLDKRLNCPQTSSAGRLFDAACGLLNVCPVAEFEGQAPMALEALTDAPEVMQGGWHLIGGVLDFAPLLAQLPGRSPRDGANLFHGTLAAGLADWVLHARAETGLDAVALGGGCFLNRVLTGRLETALQAAGMIVLKPIRLSPGDAGLSFGQAMIAALTLERQP